MKENSSEEDIEWRNHLEKEKSCHMAGWTELAKLELNELDSFIQMEQSYWLDEESLDMPSIENDLSSLNVNLNERKSIDLPSEDSIYDEDEDVENMQIDQIKGPDFGQVVPTTPKYSSKIPNFRSLAKIQPLSEIKYQDTELDVFINSDN